MTVKGKACIVFDIECLKNIFTCTCKNTETNQILIFEISERKHELKQMCEYFLNQDAYFVGYNNIHYDNPIINYCIKYRHIEKNPLYWTESIFNLSQIIIGKEDKEKNLVLWKEYKYANNFLTIDLLTMLFSMALRVSLKEMQVTMHYKNVQEFVVDWSKQLDPAKFDELISYNINDVESTEELLNRCKNDLELRIEIEKEYNLNCLSMDGVNLGISILAQEYMKKTGIKWFNLKKLRSPAETVDLEKVILPIVRFKSKILQNILEDMKSQHFVSPGRKGYENTFLFGGMKTTVGVGGIHGDTGTEIIKPKDNEVLIDSDVASLYPSMIIEHGFYPPHLGIEFLEVYAKIRTERLEAKANGNKIKNETLKLALNGLSGMLQNEYSWAYSPFTVMQIRINGQLLLLMLAERLIEVGCTLKQINTDGILYLAPKDKLSEIEKIKQDWMKETLLVLEDEEFKTFYQLAINDYFGIFPNGEVKQKGAFLTKVFLGKGLTPKIIPEAVIAYFKDGIPVEEYIQNCTDIKKFLQSEKTGKQWTVEYNDQVQQRINRYYVSESGYYLWKRKDIETGPRSYSDMGYWTMISEGINPNEYRSNVQYNNMLKGYGVKILNQFPEKEPNFAEYDVNYSYYIKEAKKIILELKPTQLSLW